MALVKLGPNGATEVDDEVFARYEQRLGDRAWASAVVRAAADPEYHQRMAQAVRSGQWPQDLLHATRELKQEMQQQAQQQVRQAKVDPSATGRIQETMQQSPRFGSPFLDRYLQVGGNDGLHVRETSP